MYTTVYFAENKTTKRFSQSFFLAGAFLTLLSLVSVLFGGVFFNFAHQGTNFYLPERQHCPEAVVVTIKWAAPASAAVLITVNAEMNNKRKEANFTALFKR